jgi:hypothetical protein
MNGEPDRNADLACATDSLVIVRVADTVNPILSERRGALYESPPQTREQAMTLVRLLLGFTVVPANGAERWTAPIAGGRRVVTLSEEQTR